MSKINIAFFGTQEFATTILEGLIADESISIETVFTQPDRKVGRKQILEESPVKALAKQHNLNIEQPESLTSYKLQATSYFIQTRAIVSRVRMGLKKRS